MSAPCPPAGRAPRCPTFPECVWATWTSLYPLTTFVCCAAVAHAHLSLVLETVCQLDCELSALDARLDELARSTRHALCGADIASLRAAHQRCARVARHLLERLAGHTVAADSLEVREMALRARTTVLLFHFSELERLEPEVRHLWPTADGPQVDAISNSVLSRVSEINVAWLCERRRVDEEHPSASARHLRRLAILEFAEEALGRPSPDDARIREFMKIGLSLRQSSFRTSCRVIAAVLGIDASSQPPLSLVPAAN